MKHSQKEQKCNSFLVIVIFLISCSLIGVLENAFAIDFECCKIQYIVSHHGSQIPPNEYIMADGWEEVANCYFRINPLKNLSDGDKYALYLGKVWAKYSDGVWRVTQNVGGWLTAPGPGKEVSTFTTPTNCPEHPSQAKKLWSFLRLFITITNYLSTIIIC